MAVADMVAEDLGSGALPYDNIELDLGQTGFGAVFNQSGTWLEHPIPELVAFSMFYGGKLFQEDERLVEAAERSIAGEPTSLTRKGSLEGPEVATSELYSSSRLTSSSAWNFFAPIESTGWVLLAELLASEFLPDAQLMLQELTKVLLVGGALLLVILALLFLRVHRGEPRRFWALSAVFAAIGLTYLEYFYILLYGMIMFAAISPFIIIRQPRLKLVQYGNNLISKLLFCPATATVMLIATLMIFVCG